MPKHGAPHGSHLPSKTKARKILSDKSVRGKKLTKKQRGFFGAVASGKVRKMAEAVNKKS